MIPPVPDLVRDRFEHQQNRDRRGWRIHLVLGILACLAMAWPTSLLEIGAAPLLGFTLIRPQWVWRLVPRLLRQPQIWLGLLFGLWTLATFLWSEDRQQAFDEWSALRWCWVPLALWPIIEGRPILLVALSLSVLTGIGSQVVHAIGVGAGIESMTFNRLPDRNSGWWDPVVGGTVLTGVLGLQLSLLLGRRETGCRARWIVPVVLTLIAILATGTRGAWLSAAALVALAGLMALGRSASVRKPRWILAGLGALVIVGGGAWFFAGHIVVDRAEKAASDLRAVREGDYSTDTGARIAMMDWAIEACMDRPLTGLGAGDWRAWMESRMDGMEASHRPIQSHDHAHHALLHIGATLGLPGLFLALAWIAVVLVASWRAGTVLAPVGLLLVSTFDAVHLNAQTGALLATIVGLTPWRCPPPRPWRSRSSTSTSDVPSVTKVPGSSTSRTPSPDDMT